jgi:nucleotide-binding universal stress UspA family protein
MTVGPDVSGPDTSVPRPGESLFARLLVPTDFSSASRRALTVALDVAQRYRSEIVLFHAAGQDANDEFLNSTGVAWGRDDVLSEARAHLQSFVDSVAAEAARAVRIEAVRDEDTVRAVVNAARQYAPSLLILGTQLAHGVLRSRTERICRSVGCPVLVLRDEPSIQADADM